MPDHLSFAMRVLILTDTLYVAPDSRPVIWKLTESRDTASDLQSLLKLLVLLIV